MIIDTENIYGKDGFVWWVGVVENRRDDPDKLGRVKVRIMGYHSDDLAVLPTELLPWAIVMQPTTSAAVSGVGSSPTNLVEGTWVIGFFLDSKEKQQPIVIGTIGGFTQRVPFCGEESLYEQVVIEGAVLTQDGTVVTDSSGAPVLSLPEAGIPGDVTTPDGETIAPGVPVPGASSPATPFVRTTLPPLSRDQIQAVMDALGERESGNNYQGDNGIGYVGKYQFGTAALEDRGLLRAGTFAAEGERGVYNDANWTTAAAPSLQAFKDNAALQEQVMFDNMAANYANLRGETGRTPVIDPTTSSPERVGGLLAAAHIGGAGGARALATTGSVATDAFGTSTRDYYNLGFTAVALAGQPGGTAAAVAASGSGVPPSVPGASVVPGGSASSAYTSPELVTPFVGQPPAPGGVGDWSSLNDILLRETEAFLDPYKEFPRCDYVEKPDTNKLATGDVIGEDTAYSRKLDIRTTGVIVARGGVPWSEPPPAYCAEYPYNQVFETEAGHVVEFDNTPGHERIQLYHREGTYIEIDVNGTSVRKVVGDNYELIERNNYINCKGAYNLTIDGATKILVKNNVDLEVYGDVNADLHRDVNMRVARDLAISVGQNMFIDVAGDLKIGTGGGIDVRSGGNFQMRNSGTNIDGGLIHLNSGRASPVVPTFPKIPTRGLAPTFPNRIRPDCFIEDPTYTSSRPSDFFTVGNDSADITLNLPQAEETIYGSVTPTFVVRDPTGSGLVTGSLEAAGVVGVPGAPAIAAAAAFVDPGLVIPPVPFAATDLIGITTFPPGLQISQFFTLGDLAPDIAQTAALAGIPVADALVNLRNLAANSLDPIAARFPDINVITGTIPFINEGLNLARNQGQASVMQFLGTAPAEYVNVAGWIRENVPYSQVALQYRTSPTGEGLIPSIAVALGSTTTGTPISTTVNGALYAPFLSNLI